jgi:hypothetical protein
MNHDPHDQEEDKDKKDFKPFPVLSNPQEEEEEEESLDTSSCHIHAHDILIGRGKRISRHEGNVQLRDKVMENIWDYIRGNKRDKSRIINNLLRWVNSLDPPGRFLEQNPQDEKWYKASFEIARLKVSQLYRDTSAKVKREEGMTGIEHENSPKEACTDHHNEHDDTIKNDDDDYDDDDQSVQSSNQKGHHHPRPNDILVGRGRKICQHSGNIKLRDLITTNIQGYIQCNKKGKTQLINNIFKWASSLDPPGRFLEQNPQDEKWYEASIEIARLKVSQLYRDTSAKVRRGGTDFIQEESMDHEGNEYDNRIVYSSNQKSHYQSQEKTRLYDHNCDYHRSVKSLNQKSHQQPQDKTCIKEHSSDYKRSVQSLSYQQPQEKTSLNEHNNYYKRSAQSLNQKSHQKPQKKTRLNDHNSDYERSLKSHHRPLEETHLDDTLSKVMRYKTVKTNHRPRKCLQEEFTDHHSDYNFDDDRSVHSLNQKSHHQPQENDTRIDRDRKIKQNNGNLQRPDRIRLLTLAAVMTDTTPMLT